MPVVASRVGGLVEAVVDGVTGVLVAPEDPAALAAAMLDLLADPRRRCAFGRAGRAHVHAQHGIAVMAEAYLRIYEELAGGVGATH